MSEGISFEFRLTGDDNLKKLLNQTKSLRKVVQVSWHKSARYVQHYVQQSMYTTALDVNGHSQPGLPPAVQSGNLVASISYTVKGWQGFEVYSDIPYAGFLELGTSKMVARPYLKSGLNHSLKRIEQLLLADLQKVFR